MVQNLLSGKVGIITGALNEDSIAWKVAECAVEQGARIVLTNTPMAAKMNTMAPLAEKCNTEIILADMTKIGNIENLYTRSIELLGGKLDFVLHSIGMSPNVRKGKEYHDINYDWYQRTLDVSAISFHKMLKIAYSMDIMNDWGSLLALSFIAAQRTYDGYSDMSDAKALLESIARNFGYRFAHKNKVRVNTLSQSPTETTAGKGIPGFENLIELSETLSPLGNATADECAMMCVALFSDTMRKVTMQNLHHDGGYVSMGMSREIMDIFNAAHK